MGNRRLIRKLQMEKKKLMMLKKKQDRIETAKKQSKMEKETSN